MTLINPVRASANVESIILSTAIFDTKAAMPCALALAYTSNSFYIDQTNHITVNEIIKLGNGRFGIDVC